MPAPLPDPELVALFRAPPAKPKPGGYVLTPARRRAEIDAHIASTGLVRPLSAKWAMIMSLQLRGHTNLAISHQLQTSPTRITAITRTERYQEALKERLAAFDSELLALKPLAIDALRDGLLDGDKNIALRASDQFFKVTGGGGVAQPSGPASAHEIARALVAEAREVHLHQEVHHHHHEEAAPPDKEPQP